MSDTRVLLADDHILFRQGVKAALAATGFLVVDEASTGREAVEKAVALAPDLILMDLYMPEGDGIWATRQIKALNSLAKVIIFTFSDDDESLFEAIKSGANGYLLKTTGPEELQAHLRAVLQGEAALPGYLAAKVLREFTKNIPGQGKIPSPEKALTIREQQVLELLTTGLKRKEISERLFVSENTVKSHLKNIMEKLHLRDRVQLAVYMIKKEREKPPKR